jgi:hypothetical protein
MNTPESGASLNSHTGDEGKRNGGKLAMTDATFGKCEPQESEGKPGEKDLVVGYTQFCCLM